MTRMPPVAQTRVLRHWRRTLLMLSSVLLVLAMTAAMVRSPLADDGREAADFVRGFSDRAIAMLSNETLDDEARTQEFRRLLRTGFHLEVIGKFVLGRYSRAADQSERAEFGRLFEDYIVASYARHFSEYGGERLVVDGGRPKGKSGAIVSSRIVRPQGAPFQVEWRLRRGAEGWRIIDVVVEGVSMAVTHRSEFSSVIASRGGSLGGLLEVLRDKTAQPQAHAAADGDESG
jgi:phospholipid transport system substrate-binding protein